MDEVLDEGIRAALLLLRKNGEFYPFSIAKDSAGGVRHVAGWAGDDHPPSLEVLEILRKGLAQGAQQGEYQTTALISDVRLRQGDAKAATDAICVELEDNDEAPVTCYLPYRHSSESIEPGDIVAVSGKSVFFPK